MFSFSPRTFHSLVIAPTLLFVLFYSTTKSADNQPPNANPDHYTVHGTFGTPLDSPPYGVLKNDSDPDGDPLSCVFTQVDTSLGTALVFANGNTSFTAAYGQTGSVTIPYTVCDNHSACAESTVTFDVVNQAPVAHADEYTVHGVFDTGLIDPPPYGVLKNDSDPEGDGLSSVDKRVDTTIGTALIYANGKASFVPNNNGQTGDVSTTYTVCDNLGACSEGNVTFHVVNQAPLAVGDVYVGRAKVFGAPLDSPPYGVLKNDIDPENDPIQTFFTRVDFTQGTGIVYENGRVDFVKGDNYLTFSGTLSMQYTLQDSLGATSVGTVTFFLIGEGGDGGAGENGGATSCNSNIGGPVNVTNGNMYVQHGDYQLPSVGYGIDVTRTYNSNSQQVNLFGRGWSTQYDESITAYDNNLLRFNQGDGRAIYFGRPVGSSGVFGPLTGDFHAQLTKSGSGFTLMRKDGSVHQFNSTGKLLSLIDVHGNQTTLTYTGGKLSSITDPFGRVVTATTDVSGRVLTLTDSIGKFATYVYGTSGQLLSVAYADNSKYQYLYTTANGNLVLATVTDALGNILENHTYDAQGRAITSEKHGGVEHNNLSFVSDTETDVTDALGRVTKYFFDKTKGRNVVTQVQGLCSCGGGAQTQSWAYDDQLNVRSHTNGLGQTVTYTYDTNGNQLSGTSVLGTSSFTYNQLGEVLTATNAMNGVTTNTYEGAGDLVSTTDALDSTTNFAYDARGELLTMTNARGKVTTLTYDTSGNISQTTDALGNITKFTYDARGRLTSVTDALNFKTSYAYDAAGRLNKITRADNSIISFTYDLAGRRTKVTDPLKFSTTFSYDSAYRLIGETDALSKSVSYSYDLMSNLVATTDQLGHTTNVAYDELNRPVTITYPPAVTGGPRLQELTAYDAAGNVTSRTDTAGRVTNYAYDNANRLISVTDPLLQVTQYEYNARSNVTAVVDALNQRYEFGYDALSRVTSATRAGLQMTYAYDEVGNSIQRTDYHNMPTNYEYDALNRLTKITYPDSSAATYGYDKLSQLTSATNINGTINFVYDKMRRVTSTTDVWGQATSYVYDVDGRRTQMNVGSTKFATYIYDSISRLTKITDNGNKNTSYTYDAASNLLTRTLSNGVVSTYSYDGIDRLTRLKDAKGTTVIADNNYTYNNAGQIVLNTDQSGGHVYGYDVLDRLTSASYPATGNESYAYDSVGNRSSSHRSAAYGYQPNNRLMSTDTASYLYDNNGDMTARADSAGTTQFVWDFENRLTNVVTPSAGSVTYKYDALGRRIQRVPSNGASTNFSYDGADVVRDKNSDATTVDYLNGPGADNKIWQKGATQYFFSQDHLGSTTALTNTSGALVERETYDAYGNSAGSALTRYGYTGRERDPLTGLQYNRARFYDPELGRFISEDPIGLAGGINQFAYVGNNPQNRVDPSGLYEIDVHYYLTYFLALKTGCFTDSEAREIANGDQGVDEDPDTRPAYGNTDRQRQVNAFYHALHPGSHQPYLDTHWMITTTGKGGNLTALGWYLHYLQDTFSHEGYTDPVCGHGCTVQHYPDKTENDVAQAQRMAAATWDALNKFARDKKCGCHGVWNPSWWPVINEFLNAPAGNRLREINSAELERKRLILAVPPR
jgi:RHS repeat-associated protein